MISPLLRVRGLSRDFVLKQGLLRREVGRVRAVDDVSFEVMHGQTLGVVGESGCGKSTMGRCVLRLLEPSAGQVWLEGKEVKFLRRQEQRDFTKHMQIVFQDPQASLNPRMTVGQIVAEPLVIHKLAPSAMAMKIRVAALLEQVGLRPEHAGRYPHEFSGGQRQRIGIARALAVEPKLIVCDEPVSALDVSVQAQVINLLIDLQRQLGLSYIFIGHDLAVVKHISDRVAVMYLGRIVEIGSSREVYATPRHPYTEALLASVPIPDPKVRRKTVRLEGEVPNPINPPTGCHFHTRCPIKQLPLCATVRPELKRVSGGHEVACHLRS